MGGKGGWLDRRLSVRVDARGEDRDTALLRRGPTTDDHLRRLGGSGGRLRAGFSSGLAPRPIGLLGFTGGLRRLRRRDSCCLRSSVASLELLRASATLFDLRLQGFDGCQHVGNAVTRTARLVPDEPYEVVQAPSEQGMQRVARAAECTRQLGHGCQRFAGREQAMGVYYLRFADVALVPAS